MKPAGGAMRTQRSLCPRAAHCWAIPQKSGLPPHGPSSAGSAAGRFGLFSFEELALNVYLDLVAHYELAVQHHVESHAEVLSVDLTLGRVADSMTHAWIIE